MKSIWIVNHYAIDPTLEPGSSRHHSLARSLAKRGWSPVIIAASTAHPSGKQRVGISGRHNVSNLSGVTFRFLRTPSYYNLPTRVINIVSFGMLLLMPSVTRGLEKPKLIIGSTVHPIAAWAASILAKRFDVPFIFEIRDLWPQTLIDMGKLRRNSLGAKFLRRIESLLCNRAAAVITLLPFAGQYLSEQGVPEEKIMWLSNGVNLDEYPITESHHSDLAEFVFMYFGSLGPANNVDLILDAFFLAAEGSSNIKLQIVGDGPYRKRLEAKVADNRHKERVTFHEPVSKLEVPDIAQTADALVISILDLPVYKYGVSMNKLFEYAASARPILIASNAPNNIVAEAEGGLCVPAGNASALGEAMLEVSHESRRSDLARWGMNARKHVSSNYDYDVLGARLDELLNQVLMDFSSKSEPVENLL